MDGKLCSSGEGGTDGIRICLYVYVSVPLPMILGALWSTAVVSWQLYEYYWGERSEPLLAKTMPILFVCMYTYVINQPRQCTCIPAQRANVASLASSAHPTMLCIRPTIRIRPTMLCILLVIIGICYLSNRGLTCSRTYLESLYAYMCC